MASTVIKRITEKAEALRELRDIIAEVEEENKRKLEILKEKRDSIQQELLSEMNKNGLASIKVQTGETFSRSVRKSIDITSEVFALKWAMEHRAVSVNKIIAMQMLKDSDKLPNGFEWSETEYISVRKPTKKNE